MTWENVRLADCCEIKPPKSEAKRKLKETDFVSFVPMSNLGIDTPELLLEEDKTLSEVAGSYTYFAENDVLLAKITPCFENGKLGIAKGLTNGIGFGSSEFIVFRTLDRLLPEYLYYYLLRPSFREAGQSVMTGAVGHKRVPKDFIEDTEIPLPSISEQKRIVAILDQAFADIDKARALTEQNLKNARELFESYLQQVFSKRGEGWVISKLSDVASVIDSLHKTPKYSDQGYPMVRVTDVKSGPLDLSETKRVSKEVYEEFSKKYKAKIGDIVFSRVGSYGRSSIVTTEEPFCLGQNTVFLAPSFNGQYFYYFLNSRYAKRQIDKLVAGTTQPTVSLKSIKAIEVPIPPKVEQLRVVEKLDEMYAETSKLERIYESKITATELLKKSLLQKAFSGELTNSSAEAAA